MTPPPLVRALFCNPFIFWQSLPFLPLYTWVGFWTAGLLGICRYINVTVVYQYGFANFMFLLQLEAFLMEFRGTSIKENITRDANFNVCVKYQQEASMTATPKRCKV